MRYKIKKHETPQQNTPPRPHSCQVRVKFVSHSRHIRDTFETRSRHIRKHCSYSQQFVYSVTTIPNRITIQKTLCSEQGRGLLYNPTNFP
ncbi:MAG: hypothetical protein IJZ06_08780 [Bacteroidales bacterium]|nr:hypothetical protein [Bacteroidales bacterium]